MNKISYLIAFSITMFYACKNNSNKESSTTDKQQKTEKLDNMETSQNLVDWTGVYEGVYDCKGCDHLKTSITLRPDNTYIYKNENVEEKAYIIWSKDGLTITLSSNGKKFKVTENKLIPLNDNEQPFKNKSINETSFVKKASAEIFEFDNETTNKGAANKIKEFLRAEFKNEKLDDFHKRFSFYELDLNGDNKNEFFVETMIGGSAGSNYYILNSDYTKNTLLTISKPPFFRSSAKTNGWNDIIMIGKKDTKGNSLSFIHLKYDAKIKSYPSNPTLIKHSNIAPSGHDMTLWHDDYGFAKPFSF